MANKPIENILIVAGPGGTAFDEQEIDILSENLRDQGATVTTIGNGRDHLSLNQITQAASELDGSATVFLYAHGTTREGHHVIDIDGTYDLRTEDLFRGIKEATNGVRVDYFMASCHGGAAQDAAMRVLPEGSIVADLAPGDQVVQGSDVERFSDTITSSKILETGFSADKILYDYLVTDLKNRIPPSITISGNGTYDLEQIMRSRIGKPFSAEETHRVHEELGNYFDKDRIDTILNEISSAGSEWDVNAREFGAALAVSYAAIDKDDPNALRSIETRTQNDGKFEEILQGFEPPQSLKPLDSGGIQAIPRGGAALER